MKFLHICFFIFVSLFIGFEVSKYAGHDFPGWMTSYFNDFLCMPIVLIICLKVVHLLKHDERIRISLPLILLLTTFYAIYFELILPQFLIRYTADPVDAIVYFSGSMLFFALQKVSTTK